ncbi:SRPBCC domain-containing protein [Oceanicola granulosus]|uniref:SRPBCC domain-containing protein n=1 Tax=Oceanicola granulosus TaxID=252302 RepID=UPI00178C1EB3|nr:SRPBCC domain-containing protein [Oceanicola granulosus]
MPFRLDQYALEKRFSARIDTLFRIFSTPDLAWRWQFEDSLLDVIDFRSDFTVGGGLWTQWRIDHGAPIRVEIRYEHIERNARIASTYRFWQGDTFVSLSLADLTFRPEGDTTLLNLSESIHLYSDVDDTSKRRDLTSWSLGRMEQLAQKLEREAV